MEAWLRESVSGVVPALVTPFSKDASAIDAVSYRRLITHVHSGGAKAVVACGSTGEAVALSDREYAMVIKLAADCFQGVVIAGCGASSTQRTIELGTLAKENGAKALLVVNPPYNKPTSAGLLAHYRAVASATALPIIAYNVPGRTGANLPVDVVVELAKEGTIVGIKESSGSIEQMIEIASRVPPSFVVLAGEDGLILPSLSVGALGVVSVVGNIVPQIVTNLIGTWSSGEIVRARALQFALFPLVKAVFAESNPIPIKALLAERRIIDTDSVRLPLVTATAATRERLAVAFTHLAP